MDYQCNVTVLQGHTAFFCFVKQTRDARKLTFAPR